MARRKLLKGIRENKGTFEARAMVNGVKVHLYGSDLDKLIEEFETAKDQAKNCSEYRRATITLNEWFEEWFSEVKAHKVKETSISPMKNNFKRTFGFYIGTKKIKEIKPLDVQRAINAMEQAGMSNSAMREALGRLRECMEFAVGNQLISANPCLIVEVPWTYKQSKEEIALTQEDSCGISFGMSAWQWGIKSVISEISWCIWRKWSRYTRNRTDGCGSDIGQGF